MTKLKVIATIVLLLASQSAFARGGGGGMSHGDHTGMVHHDRMTMTHGHNMVRLTAHRTAELRHIENQIRIVGGKLVQLVNMGLKNSRQFKILARQFAALNARLARFGLPPVQVGLGG